MKQVFASIPWANREISHIILQVNHLIALLCKIRLVEFQKFNQEYREWVSFGVEYVFCDG